MEIDHNWDLRMAAIILAKAINLLWCLTIQSVNWMKMPNPLTQILINFVLRAKNNINVH